MMLSLSAAASLEKDDDFKARVNMAFNVVAHEVLAESQDVEHHILRTNHANRVLQFPADRVDAFVAGVVGSPAVQQSSATDQTEITDDQILEGVRQCWNGLIGINPDTP